MSLRFGLPVVIMSTVFVSQMILNTEAQSGTVKTAQHITFDCDPEQLHGAAKLLCLVKTVRRGPPALRRRDLPGQRPDLRHVPQRRDRHVLAQGRAEAAGEGPHRSTVRR